MKPEIEEADFVILGAGFVGSVAAMCLRQKGYRVSIVDKSFHPRFSIGESTTPELNIRLRDIGQKLNLWELVAISSYFRLKKAAIPVNFTPKESFYFVHHEKHKPINPEHEIFQQTSPWPSGPDLHYQRDKMDEFLLTRAVSRGARYFPTADIKKIRIVKGFAETQMVFQESHYALRSKMILDCSGVNSPLVAQFSLRKSAPKPFLNSRAIFTHMQNLGQLDQIVKVRKSLARNPTTQHHISRHTWLWIIPLSGDLYSVGLVRNSDFFPNPDCHPAAEFNDYIKDYPDLIKVFQNACIVRPWISAPKLQYRSSKMAGNRFLLFPTAAGFIDPLLSTGLAMNITALTKFIDTVDELTEKNDFSRNKLLPFEKRMRTEIKFLDMYMHSLFMSFGNVKLFSLVFNIFRLGILLELSGMDDKAFSASMWHTENKDFQILIQKIHAYLLSVQNESEFAALTEDKLVQIIGQHDQFDFWKKGIGSVQSEYPVSVFQLLPWILRRKTYKSLLFSSTTMHNIVVILKRYFQKPLKNSDQNIWGPLRWRSIKNLLRLSTTENKSKKAITPMSD